MDFDKQQRNLEEDLFEDDPFLDAGEDTENREHDYKWGKYLFELHTCNGTTPVTPELAATLLYRDLECIMLYPTPEEFDFLTNDVVTKTISVCAKELSIRDQRI